VFKWLLAKAAKSLLDKCLSVKFRSLTMTW